MATQLDEIFFELSIRRGSGVDAEIAKFTGGIKKSGDAANKAGDDFKKYGKDTKKAGDASKGLTNTVKKLIVAMGGLIIVRKVASAMLDFETAMAEVATIAGGGAEQVDELRTATLALSRVVPQSATELGAGAYQILSAGISDTSDILSVLEASTKAAVAGLTSTETAVDAVTTVLNSFQLDASEATRVADILFKTVELGKLRFVDLAQNIGNAATSAALAGVSVEELTSGIAVLTQRGVNAAEATSSLNRLFLTLTQQTTEQEAAFERLGISFSVATVAEKGFAGLLEEVNQLSEGQIDTLAELFPNIRAARAAFVLAGTALDDYKDTLRETENAQGASQRAFEIMNQTATNQGKILRNNVIATFQEIGFSVLPGVSKAFAFLSDKINKFVGGIKLIAVETAVLSQRFIVVEETIEAAFASLFDIVVTGAQKAVSFVVDLLAKLAEKTSGIPILGNALDFNVTLLRSIEGLAITASEATNSLAQGARDQLATERALLESIKDVAEEEKLRIVQESEFIAQRQEATAAAERQAEAEALLTRLSNEQLERRAELQDELSKRVREATQTDTQQAIASIRQLRAAYETEFMGISDEAEEAFRIIEDAARAALTSDLENELADRIRDVVTTAAEQEIQAIAELRAAYEKEFGTITEEVDKAFSKIEARAELALSRERASELAESFSDALSTGLAQIEFSVVDIADDEERTEATLRRQVALMENVLAEARDRLATTENTTEEEIALRAVIVDIVGLLRRTRGEQKKVGDEAKKDASQRLKDLQSSISLVRQAADGALDLAAAFGLVNEETREVINNIGQIAEGAATAAAGIATANPAAIVSGGLGVLGGLSGLVGESESSKRRKANTEALKELTTNVKTLASVFESTPSNVFGDASKILDDVFGGATDISNARRGFVTKEEFEVLQEAADALGIAIKGFKVGDVVLLTNDFEDLLAAMNALDVTRLVEDFAGASDVAKQRREIFDEETPEKELEDLFSLFKQFTELPDEFQKRLDDIDLSTASGRAALDQLVKDLFEALVSGELDVASGALGGLTVNEFIEALGGIERILDDLGISDETSEDEEGETRQFQVSRQITEITGSRIAGFLSNIDFTLDRSLTVQEAMLIALQGGNTVGVIPEGAESAIPEEVAAEDPTSVVALTENTAALVMMIEELQSAALLLPPNVAAATASDSQTAGDIVNTISLGGITINVSSSPGATAQETGEVIGQSIAEELDALLGERFREAERVVGEVRL